MNLLINILLSATLIFAANKNSNNIKVVLKNNLNDVKRFEYKIISPKNVDLSNITIDNAREVKIEKGYAYLPVLFAANRNTKNGIITLKLKLYKDVAVSINDIKRKETISKSDFRIEEKEISTLRDEPIEINKIITQLRAKRNIKHGTIILANMIEKIPDIKRGSRVNAIFQKGIVNVSFSATARTEGKVGDIIKVKRNDNKIFKAEIISSKQVRIIE
jgi:flagella basal body P-ring formation protein FlgA